MNARLVSVVVPTYNRAYCLGATLASVLAQTHRDLELIVVDDGSTDETRGVVESIQRNDDRVLYVHQENAGVAAARNRGLEKARGAYVALIDSDDTWSPWKLELQVACLTRRPEVGMCWTDMDAVDPEGRVIATRYLRTMYHAYRWFPTSADLFPESEPLATIAPHLEREVADGRFWFGDVFSPMVMGSLVHTSTVMLRRDRLEHVGRFDEALRPLGEDYPFHLRTCREGSVGFIDVPAIRYQRGMPDRLTRPEYSIYLATAFLSTIEQTLAADRDRIRLPAAMISAVRAEAHAWVGEIALDAGNRALACRNLAWSLRFDPRQPRVAARLALAMLPPSWARALRDRRRRRRAGL